MFFVKADLLRAKRCLINSVNSKLTPVTPCGCARRVRPVRETSLRHTWCVVAGSRSRRQRAEGAGRVHAPTPLPIWPDAGSVSRKRGCKSEAARQPGPPRSLQRTAAQPGRNLHQIPHAKISRQPCTWTRTKPGQNRRPPGMWRGPQELHECGAPG
jgi:hypothetical protein